MKNIEALQFEIFANTKSATLKIDNIIEKLHSEIKDPSLNQTQRNLMREDLKKLVHIREQLRSLSIMQDFYQKYVVKDDKK